MNKEALRQAAEQLLTTETVCRRLYRNKESGFGKACDDVEEFTNHVKELQKQIPDMAEKQYWWNIPFSPEECEEYEGFCFEDGEYIESDSIRTKEEAGKIILFPKSITMDYGRLARDLTEGLYIPLFINKKKLRVHLNDSMVCRVLYNVTSFQKWEMNTPDLTQDKDSMVETWQDYQEEALMKREEYEEYLRIYNEKMDGVERTVHLSLFTNEERWLAGTMSTEDYLKESTLREWGPLEKRKKMQNHLDKLRMQATRETQKMRERQMEMRKNAMCGSKIIRMLPVGHVVYCEDELMAVFLNKTESAVLEYEFAPVAELEDACYNVRTLYRKKPMLIPLVQHLAKAYNEKLPDFNVFSIRPEDCPEFIWRNWILERWEQQQVAE